MLNSLPMQELMLFTFPHLGMRQWNSQILTLSTCSFDFQKKKQFFSFYRLVKKLRLLKKKVDRYIFSPFLRLLEQWVIR